MKTVTQIMQAGGPDLWPNLMAHRLLLASETFQLDAILGVRDGRPVPGQPDAGQAVAPRRSKTDRTMPGQAEAMRRRQVIADFVAALQPGETFTAKDVINTCGEPDGLYRQFNSLLNRMVLAGELGRVAYGNVKAPGVYTVPATTTEGERQA